MEGLHFTPTTPVKARNSAPAASTEGKGKRTVVTIAQKFGFFFDKVVERNLIQDASVIDAMRVIASEFYGKKKGESKPRGRFFEIFGLNAKEGDRVVLFNKDAEAYKNITGEDVRSIQSIYGLTDDETANPAAAGIKRVGITKEERKAWWFGKGKDGEAGQGTVPYGKFAANVVIEFAKDGRPASWYIKEFARR